MARILVQLKLRLLRNALRASTAGKLSFIISLTFAVLVAAGTFTVLALLRGQRASVDVTTVIFTMFAFGWLILPIFVFGLDGTLDPATLALYPLRTRPLAVGLLAASAAGAWPLANLVGLLGVLAAVVAVPLQVLFCIVLARFVTTGMAGLLRSRRGKDLAAFLVIPIFALYEFFTQVVPRVAAQGKFSASSFTGVDSWLRCRLAWRRTRSGTLPTGTPVLPWRAWRCWPRSSPGSAGCGHGRSAAPWSPSTRPRSPRGCAARRCRWAGQACAAPWPHACGSISAATPCPSSTGS